MNGSPPGLRSEKPTSLSWRRSSATTWSARGCTATNSDRDHDPELAAAARGRLTSAGRRALTRQDTHAATNLLARAAALVPEGEVDVPLELSFVLAFGWVGKGQEAARRAGSVAERAAAAGDRLGEFLREARGGHAARLSRAGGRGGATRRARRGSVAGVRDGRRRLCAPRRVSGARARRERARTDGCARGTSEGRHHAQRMGFPNQHLLAWCEVARFHGTTPASELLARQDERDAERLTIWLRGPARGRWRCSAVSARRGRCSPRYVPTWPAEAEDCCPCRWAWRLRSSSWLAIPRCRRLRKRCLPAARELEYHNYLAPAAGWLGQANYALGRLDEATAWADLAAELPVIDNGRWRPPGDLPARRAPARRVSRRPGQRPPAASGGR